MSSKGVADIVFCLDASQSMQPCFNGVREHVVKFIDGLKSNPQFSWDWRIDFVAHSAGAGSNGGVICRHESMRNEELVSSLYAPTLDPSRFFTTEVDEFRRGLQRIQLRGDEAPMIALDCCLDFPWRTSRCHRVVVFMTDEPFEDGVGLEIQRAALPLLKEKIQQLRVMLFIVAPDSAVYDDLSALDKSEYEAVDAKADGLRRVDFGKVLGQIGKSVSVQQWQVSGPESAHRGLFGQASWGTTTQAITGA